MIKISKKQVNAKITKYGLTFATYDDLAMVAPKTADELLSKVDEGNWQSHEINVYGDPTGFVDYLINNRYIEVTGEELNILHNLAKNDWVTYAKRCRTIVGDFNDNVKVYAQHSSFKYDSRIVIDEIWIVEITDGKDTNL